ncbi:hypothetical protein Hanom_Chr15g01354151 [Helianthus anomalus]
MVSCLYLSCLVFQCWEPREESARLSLSSIVYQLLCGMFLASLHTSVTKYKHRILNC